MKICMQSCNVFTEWRVEGRARFCCLVEFANHLLHSLRETKSVQQCCFLQKKGGIDKQNSQSKKLKPFLRGRVHVIMAFFSQHLSIRAKVNSLETILLLLLINESLRMHFNLLTVCTQNIRTCE